MTTLLSILVLVFILVAIWQMVKIFDLTQTVSTGADSQIANDKDNKLKSERQQKIIKLQTTTTTVLMVI